MAKYHPRHNQRKRLIERFFMPMLKILALILMLGLIIFGLLKSNQADFLKVDIRWEIDKNLPVGQALLASKIQPLITGKYQLDLQDIKSVLELEPWVQTAHINRLFWNTLKIKITPQTVAMRWENVNCKSKKSTLCKGYISTKGELFLPQKFIKSEVVLALSKWDENLAKKLYQDFQNYQKLSNKMLIKSFSRTNIDQLVFSSGVRVILGYQRQNQRLKRFMKAYKKLKNKRTKRATFDMRYPKGFAVSY